MKTEREKEAIAEQLGEFLDNTSIADKYDFGVVALAILSALAFSIAKTYPGDRQAQMHVADMLAASLRELVERADPDATALQ